MSRSCYQVTAIAAVDPVLTTQEAKDYLRLETDADDALVARQVASATRYVQDLCWSAFCPQQWELVLDAFPCGTVINLERGPLISVDSVKYRDENGTEQTFYDYWQDTARKPGRVLLKETSSWPTTERRPDAVRVRFTVGFASAAAVPPELKSAILMVVAHLYENREPEVTGTITAQFSVGVKDLVSAHRLVRF